MEKNGEQSFINPLVSRNKGRVSMKKVEMIKNMRRKNSTKGSERRLKSSASFSVRSTKEGRRRRASTLGTDIQLSIKDVVENVALRYGGDTTAFNATERKFLKKLEHMDEDGDGTITLTEIINSQVKLEHSTMVFNLDDVEKVIMEKYGDQKENISSEDQNLIFTLRSLDKDGDGEITLSEILAIQSRLQNAESDKRNLIRIVGGMAVLFFIFLIGTFLMTFAANEATKEVRVSREGAML
eukprot:g12337.t1